MKPGILFERCTYAGLALWFAMLGCGLSTTSVDQVRNESQSVEIQSATSARIQIDFPAGELTVQAGAGSLMEADFQYNVDKWKPQVQYSENGAQGELVVNQPQSDSLPVGGELVNTWKLLLGNDIPLSLSINTGAGNSELNLDGLDLTDVNIEIGTGTTHINLDGNWDHDVTASIHGGVGELNVSLPSQMGVWVEMETAIVNVNTNGLIVADKGYINKTYGTSLHTLTLKLEAGVGSVTLTVPEQ